MDIKDLFRNMKYRKKITEGNLEKIKRVTNRKTIEKFLSVYSEDSKVKAIEKKLKKNGIYSSKTYEFIGSINENSKYLQFVNVWRHKGVAVVCRYIGQNHLVIEFLTIDWR